MNNIKKVLILGAGQLGERSIQSLKNSSYNFEVHFYEINNERAKYIINTYGIKQHKDIDDLSFFDVIHIATTSTGRQDFLINNTISDDSFVLVEKPIASSYSHLNELSSWKNKKNFYVNLNRRHFPINISLKNILKGPFSLECRAENLHILGNISHFLDLMRFFGIESKYIINVKKQDIFETKRKGFFDLKGDMSIDYDCGSKLLLADNATCIGKKEYIYKYKYNSNILEYDESNKLILKNTFDKAFKNDGLLKYHSDIFANLIVEFFDKKKLELPNLHTVAKDNLTAYQFMHELFKIDYNEDIPVS